MDNQVLDALMSAVLRGEAPAWPGWEDSIAAFVRRSEYHGVQGLLHEALRDRTDWPQPLLSALRAAAMSAAMWELRHQQVVGETLAALEAAGIHPLLFKGTALAYSLYGNPTLRTRGDTDLIVPPQDRVRALSAIAALGFTRVLEQGELMSYQACLTREVPGGGEHTLDLHWKINNSELLSRLFDYPELRQAARPLPALSPHAYAVSPVHALLIACFHRAGHKQAPYYVDGVAYYSGDRLIWLYDIHLLARDMTPEQWDEFCTLAARKGMRKVCLEGIDHTCHRFGTAVPDEVLAALAYDGHEPVAEYMDANHLRRRWLDFRALDGVPDKLRFIGGLAFPPHAYMLELFPRARVKWLPWLYVLRTLRALRARGEGSG